MNILLTSVGRRAYMVKYFKEVIGNTGKVHVCNSSDLSVAFQYADKGVVSPLIYSEQYIPFLLFYCAENKIDILISLFDIDLYILAKNKEKFAAIGTKVIVSDADFVKTCNDKWETYTFLKEKGFNVPKTYLSLEAALSDLKLGELTFPLIVKPRFGCGSIQLNRAENEEDLEYLYGRVKREIKNTYLKYESDSVSDSVLIQEMLNGQEYGADIINDLNGNFCNAIIKKKLAMRSGETDIAETINEPYVLDAAVKLGKLTGHIANLDCDIFLVKDKPYILEMNARFGGGYPFSHVAGCNLPKAICAWVSDKAVACELLQAQEGIRSFKEIVLNNNIGGG